MTDATSRTPQPQGEGGWNGAEAIGASHVNWGICILTTAPPARDAGAIVSVAPVSQLSEADVMRVEWRRQDRR